MVPPSVKPTASELDERDGDVNRRREFDAGQIVIAFDLPLEILYARVPLAAE